MFEFLGRRRVAAELELSPVAFEEVVRKLREAGIGHRIVGHTVMIDSNVEMMLTCGEEAAPSHPAHRPIAPNAKYLKREPKR